LTRRQIAIVQGCNESRIKELIHDHDYHYTDLEQAAITPETGEMEKLHVRKAIANAFGAVFAGKEPE
jgi:hypothetical protein